MWSLHAIQRHNSPEYLLICFCYVLCLFICKSKKNSVKNFSYGTQTLDLFIATESKSLRVVVSPIRSERDRWFHFRCGFLKFSSSLLFADDDDRFYIFAFSLFLARSFPPLSLFLAHICLLFKTCYFQYNHSRTECDKKLNNDDDDDAEKKCA